MSSVKEESQTWIYMIFFFGASMTDVHVHVHVLRKMFFRLVTSVGQRKILSPQEESNLRPSDLRSDALHYAIDIADPSSMQDTCH